LTSLRTFVAGLIALGAACEKQATSPTTPFAVRFSVTNHLVSPVTISIDSTPVVIVMGGKTASLTVPSTAKWLAWISAKAAGSNGALIPDDISEVKVPIAGIGAALDIINVINDQAYITAMIYNSTSAPVSIGVYDGASVTCAAELPAATSTSKGFTQIGYYRLLSTTEVRAYRAPSGCTGSFISWPQSQLKTFATKSGLLTLTLDAAPVAGLGPVTSY
jgi:hypothetical protein